MSEKGTYETFDSGSGPVIPDKGDYAHEDDGKSDKGDIEVEHGAVPQVPQVS